jgi:hypothetical protein
VTRRLLRTVILIGFATHVVGQGVSRPDVPDKIKAPGGEEVVLQAHASGSQIYVCQDGSEVTGKAVARVDAPDADSIPWLLVTVTGHSGNGVLSRVTSIQRIHTKAGQSPPAGDCNTSKQNVEIKRSYTADYYFYAPPK